MENYDDVLNESFPKTGRFVLLHVLIAFSIIMHSPYRRFHSHFEDYTPINSNGILFNNDILSLNAFLDSAGVITFAGIEFFLGRCFKFINGYICAFMCFHTNLLQLSWLHCIDLYLVDNDTNFVGAPREIGGKLQRRMFVSS